MAILSWGKCTITYAVSEDGAAASDATWTEIDTPKKDTTELTTTAGDETLAQEEGGEVVDARYGKASYELAFDLFVKKDVDRPWDDTDGVIDNEYALRVVPEDTSCEGIQIDRCILRVEESYTTADGKTLHYVAKCLKPASGKTVKPYTAG